MDPREAEGHDNAWRVGCERTPGREHTGSRKEVWPLLDVAQGLPDNYQRYGLPVFHLRSQRIAV